MSIAPRCEPAVRIRLRVSGTVQGVGFRPHVYRLAHELGVAGFVLNDAHGVVIEAEGPAGAVAALASRVQTDAPPLAVVEGILHEPRAPLGEQVFEIRQSLHQASPDAPVSPDAATCLDCLRELRDTTDRRYRYPFINCTNCGPRFTIVTGIPYDRPATTMAGFDMCPACRSEYEDPADRRFHAQPNACPECGPGVSLLDRTGAASPAGAGAGDLIAAAARALRQGLILAIKGIGGYHLACRAGDEGAVSRLRAGKHREHKPFALMTISLESAGRLVDAGPEEHALLTAPARPIVLAPRRPAAPVAPSVAPGCPELGVMLPYSPLHHLLLEDARCDLVMTSANVSDEPICFRDEEALERLRGIADLFLVHNRPIQTRTDDSVVRVVKIGGRPRPISQRRSRGYVPAGLPLPAGALSLPLLACGAELKSTFCVAKGGRAWVSHHIGDLENAETLHSFTAGIEHFERLFAVSPEIVAHDLHPGYLSTSYALGRESVELVAVQHHHAHLAACLAEHGETGVAVGAIFDGTGYGPDGTVWGGELLLGDTARYRRVGHLRPVRMPGGERAIRQPWRMACAWLQAAQGADPDLPGRLTQNGVTPAQWEQVARLAQTGLAAPLTSSVGRLFDAVSALCGVCPVAHYEGQAAIELQASCDPHERGFYPMELSEADDGGIVIDPREMITAIATDLRVGVTPAQVATRFHSGLAEATVAACARAAHENATELVVLSGGVFANRRLLEQTAEGLGRAGLRALVPRALPAGDGGISYGQAAVALAPDRTGGAR